MKKRIFHLITLIVIVALPMMFEHCASSKKNVFSKTYHNTTAHFNSYFIARENIAEIEALIEDSYRRDYDQVLMIFPDIDSATIDGQREKLDDTIIKASLAIQRHENSKWVDDSYLLVGKARFYGGDFVNAIETFKYVYTQSEDDDARHRALVDLMRTYIHYNEHNNAMSVSDVLMKEGPNKENLKKLLLTRAYMYQLRGDDDNMVQNLSEAAKLVTKKKYLAKYYFILGQVYQEIGFEAESYNNYKKCLKSNPDFELAFYAKLNLAQVTHLDQKVDVKKIRGYFRKLLKDDKNKEFKDRIYYEMARFELKHQNYELAVELLQTSLTENQNNPRQKGLSYLKLGELYYDHYKNYRQAQAYYDSTVSVLPRDYDTFEEIQKRQQILNDFVKQIEIIQTQDSLLALAKMDPSQLDRLLDEVIVQREIQRKQEEKDQRKQQRAAAGGFNQANAEYANPFNVNPDAPSEGAQWYFYNLAAVSAGRSAFLSRWGNRVLEDNWRRSKKESIVSFDEEVIDEEVELEEEEEVVVEGTSPEEEKEQLKATIPTTVASQEDALHQIEEAYYNLGNIYHFQLEEINNAVQTYDTLLYRFPQSEHKPEVLYTLFIIYHELDSSMAEKYKQLLVEEFPETLYANLAINPNYEEESNETNQRLQQLYKIAYDYFESGDYNQAGLLVSRALEQYPDNDFSDHLQLLGVLIDGKVDGQYKYQYELQQFIENNPESDLLTYAQNLLSVSQGFDTKMAQKEGARFSPYLEQAHFFVIIYNSSEELSQQVSDAMDDYIGNNYPDDKLITGNLIFKDNETLLLVNKFETKESALAFYKAFKADNPVVKLIKEEEYSEFIITEDNFEIFYRTKQLENYMNFFNEQYQ